MWGCNPPVQGRSSKFAPHAQKVGLNHQVNKCCWGISAEILISFKVADEDVVSSTYFELLLCHGYRSCSVRSLYEVGAYCLGVTRVAMYIWYICGPSLEADLPD